MKNISLKGAIFVILAGILWGTTGTSQGLAPQGVSSSVIGALRLLVAGVIFTSLLFLKANFPKSRLSNKELVFLIIGTLSVVFYQLTFFYGVRLAGVAVGTVIGIGSSPLWAGFLGYIFLKEKPLVIWYISTVIAIVGLVLLSFSGNVDSSSVNVWGVFLMLMAGFTYAMYSLCAKKLMVKLHADFVMAAYFMGGGLIMLPILFFNDLQWLMTIKGSLLILHLGVFATAIAYLLFSRGLQLVPISKATTLSLTEPLTASLLGILVLGEKISFFSGLGMGLIFVSILLLAKK